MIDLNERIENIENKLENIEGLLEIIIEKLNNSGEWDEDESWDTERNLFD